MTDKETLIECWTRCLDDNAEEQIHAQTMLAENIDENAPAFSSLTAHLHNVTEKRRKSRRLIMGSLAILAILLCLTHYALPMQIRALWKASKVWSLDPNESLTVPTATPDERLLLYGDTVHTDKSSLMRPLWESDPKNPAYFAEYSQYYMQRHSSLPPDFLKIAIEIDPDNAWFTCTAAAVLAKDSIDRGKAHPLSPVDEAELKKMSHEERLRERHKLVLQYDIIDPLRAQQAMDLWRQSLQQNRYENYKTAMHQKRYPLLRNRDTYFSQYAPYFYSGSQPSDLRTRYLTEVIVAHMQVADLDTMEGKLLIDEVGLYAERLLATEPGSFMDALILHATLDTIYRQVAIMDIEALQPEVAATWKKRNESFHKYRITLDEHRRNADDETARIHGSFITQSMLALGLIAVSSPPLTLDYITPQRYAENAYLYRAGAAFLSVLLVLLIPFHLLIDRRKPLVRLADEAWLAVPRKNLVRMYLYCVLLPLLYVTSLVVFTPLSGKNYGVGLEFEFPLYPAVSVALMILLIPRLLAHRFTGGWGQLTLKRRRWYHWFGWASLALAIVPLHALPMLNTLLNNFEMVQIISLACWVPAILWLLGNAGVYTFTRDPFLKVIQGLRRRMVALCSVAGMVTLSLAGVALLQCEKYWVQKDNLMEIPADMPVAGEYEASVTKALHQDLLKIMNE